MTTFAFPSGHNPQRGRQEDGMTLRDYFAAKIAAVIVADLYNEDMYITEHEDAYKQAAVAAYQMADYMLKARDE